MAERNRSDVEEYDTPGTTGKTLPPERMGKTSGQFDFRDFLRKSGYPPAKLMEPNLGGTVLNNFLAWTILDGETQKMMLDELLHFISVDPIPSDAEIIREIVEQQDLATKKIAGKTILEEYTTLPEPISVALIHYIFEIIDKTPALSLKEIGEIADQMANLAHMEMEHALIAKVDPQSTSKALKYASIAQAVIETRERLLQATRDISDERGK